MVIIQKEVIAIIIERDESRKIATIWCSNADKERKEIQDEIKKIIAECKEKKIFVCVFKSGKEDLLENTKNLLSYNYNNIVNAQS
ncbi:MAG: hypothetical protein MJ173_09470 [Clostridia bacterium]|nr:hypothetical protein [Clostridia bacterium]